MGDAKEHGLSSMGRSWEARVAGKNANSQPKQHLLPEPMSSLFKYPS